MPPEYDIDHRETGSLGENDEYWTLVVPENGAPMVRHDRSWGNPYRGEVKRDPPELSSLSDFLAKPDSWIAHEKLMKLLRKLRIDPNA